MNKFLQSSLILLILIFSLIIPLSYAQSADIILQDTAFYDETGIDPSALEGCDSDCTYESGTLTLGASATLTLTEIPDDLIIEINGGTIVLPSGTTLNSGILDTSSMTYQDGYMKIKGFDADLTINFENTDIQYGSVASLYGTGKIEDGNIAFIESGSIQLKGYDVPIYVNNLYDPSFVSSVTPDGENPISSSKYVFLQAPIDENTRIGSEKGYVSLTGSGDFFIVADTIICQSDCNYEIVANPGLFIEGSGVVSTALKSSSGGYIAQENKKTSTRTVSINGGPSHVFEGTVFPTNEGFIFPQGRDPLKAQSIDGIYVNSEKTAVQVFFEKPEQLAGNYLVVGDNYLRAGGSGYSIAFGDVGGGNPSNDFRFTYTEQNKYIPHEEGSSYRLSADLQGGEVVYYQSTQGDKITVTQPGVSIVNGLNNLDYYSGETGVEYDYEYIPCTRGPPGKNVHASCGEVDTNMYDGGTVNVAQEVGTGYSVTHEQTTLEFTIEAKAFTLADGTDTGLEIPAQEHKYELDTGKVYLLGYKGGAAAEALAGDGTKSLKEWGHAGLMYYKEGQWWVAEENGVSAEINPFEKSLFAYKTNGVFEVQVEDPTPIIAAAERVAGADYKAYHSAGDALNYFEEGYTCSSFCEFALSASSEIDDPSPQSVSFTDYTSSEEDVSMTQQILGTLVPLVEETPRSILIGNPNLVEVPNLAGGSEEPIVKSK